jgi:competence transcription factor ComK
MKEYLSKRETVAIGRRQVMGVKGLAEGIIMQSIEDLWNENLRDESIAFFKGKEFRICAEVARMSLDDQVKTLNLVRSIVDDGNEAVSRKRSIFAERIKRPAKVTRRLHRFTQAVT